MEDRYAYDVEWKDPRTGVVWNYQLYLYPETGEVEMVGVTLHLLLFLTDASKLASKKRAE